MTSPRQCPIHPAILLIWILFFALALPAGHCKTPTAPAHAWEETELDSDMADPFAAADAAAAQTLAAPPKAASPFHMGGYLEFTTEIGFNKSQDKLSSLRPLIHLEGEYKISHRTRARVTVRGAHEAAYQLTHRGKPGTGDQDDEEWEGELREAYVDTSFADWIHLRAGRQIISPRFACELGSWNPATRFQANESLSAATVRVISA